MTALAKTVIRGQKMRPVKSASRKKIDRFSFRLSCLIRLLPVYLQEVVVLHCGFGSNVHHLLPTDGNLQVARLRQEFSVRTMR